MLALLGGALASGQTAPFDFTLLATAGGNTAKIQNGQQLAINAGVSTRGSITITATYTGTSQATFSTQPDTWLLGSTEFSISVPAKETFPLVLSPTQSLTFTITYAPTNASQALGSLTIPYAEAFSNGTLNSDISLTLVGTSPAFTLSYILASANNVIPIAPGGTIPFLPPTLINTTASAQLNITNTGSGPGTITGISLATSSVFKLSGIPLFPYPLPANSGSSSTLPVVVLYTPTAVENDTGQITITYGDGTTATVNLTGSGATSSYTYSYVSGSGMPISVKPGGTITLPSVTVATSGTTPVTSSVILTAKNAGNANGTINSVNAVPTPTFQVTGPLSTPPTLKPGDTESFTITYTPTAVGTQTGTLVVGNDQFTLSSQGLGPLLSFSYTSGGIVIPVPPGSVVFPSIEVSQSEMVSVTVTNSGTSTATVSLISTSPNPPFSVPALPPVSLLAGQSTTVPVTFTPVIAGPASGTLLVNSTSVTLVGAGTAPPTVPSYTISGPSGNVSPLTQAGVSLTLAKPYPVDLNGVLTLTTSGSLGTDPAVQFSTGSSTGNRTVDFTIPANSTSADFVGQGSQILLQTGTVAETITLTPSFTTTGGVAVTPTSLATLQFTVPSSAPVLTIMQPTSEAASSFTLLITGYSTPRDLNSLTVTFNAAPGYTLATSQFTADLSQLGALWFQGVSSQAFGGQFEITIPFNLTGKVATGKTLLGTIASVSATVSNSVGTSTSIQVNLP